MADTMGTPAKGIKKKKAFAFLKSGPEPAPSSDATGGHFSDQAGEYDDGLDLFRRSRDFFPVVVQEQVHPQVTSDQVEDHDRLSQEQDSTQSPSPPSSKRRKLSSPVRTTDFGDTEDDLYGPPTPPRRVANSISTSPQKPNTMRSTPSPAQSKGKERMQLAQGNILLTPTRSSSNQPCANEVISLDDGDDDAFEELPPSGRATSAATTSTRTIKDVSVPRDELTPSPGPITVDDSDDDVFENSTDPADGNDPFAHFVVRAREREDAAKAEAAAAAASRSESQPSTPDGAPKREPMIEVKIFVQSRMARFPVVGPPFGARRGMSQNLGVIRRTFLMWLRRGGHAISDEDEANVFLTWKRRKIYDASTGVNLGWRPSAADDPSSSSTPGFMKGGILLEAWTQEDYDGWLTEEEKLRMVKRGDLVEDVFDEEHAEVPDEKDARIRISIKEKDQEPFKLSVYTDTEIRLLVPAIRKMRNIPNDRDIKLRYEGEWLEGAGTVEEADIEDLCTVEMYVR